MKKLAVVLAVLLWAGQVSAATITTLYNTGVDNSGALLSGGTVDSHYVFTPGGTQSDAYVVSSLGGGWASVSGSKWISSAANNAGSTGTYSTTFDLSGFDAATAMISGQLSYDDDVDIFLNGNKVYSNYNNNWNNVVDFTINSFFAAGVNTLDFYIANSGGGPTGLSVAMTGTASPVPVPAAVWMLGSGLVALLGIRRKVTK